MGPSGVNFPWTGKNAKTRQLLPIFLGGPMGPIHPVWDHLVIFSRAFSGACGADVSIVLYSGCVQATIWDYSAKFQLLLQHAGLV